MNHAQSPLLITGADGFIGRALVRAAAGQRRLRLGVRNPWPEVGQEQAVMDLSDPASVRAAVDGVDCVVHLAGLAHDRAPARALAMLHDTVNRQGSVDLARAAVAAGARRFVLMSTAKVFGETSAPGRPFHADTPVNPVGSYARSKWAAEREVREIAAAGSMELVVLRPPLVYGPGVGANMARMMRWVRRGVPLPLGKVNNLRSLVALDNLVSLLLRSVDHPGAPGPPLLPTDGQDLSTPELIRLIAAAMGRRPWLLPVPVPLLRIAAGTAGRSADIQRLCGNLQLDSDDTRRRLGWVPPLPMDAAIRRMVEDCRFGPRAQTGMS